MCPLSVWLGYHLMHRLRVTHTLLNAALDHDLANSTIHQARGIRSRCMYVVMETRLLRDPN